MDTTVIIERATRAIKADATVFSEIGADESHTSSAAAVVGVVGFVGGFINGVFNANSSPISGAFGGLVGAFIAWGIGSLVFYGLAKMFGGEGDLQGLMRGNAYAAVPSALGGIPVLGWVISLWGVYLFILNVRENMKLSTGAAAAVVLIPVVIAIALVLLIVLVLVAAIAGST
jgi:hypothetical protein